MAKQQGISKKTLNDVIKKFPMPIQDHLRRVKLMASFVLEKISGEDWFIDLNLNPDDIESAAYYHDIGKQFVKKDYYYFLYCNNVEEKDAYRLHVDEGVKYLKKEFNVTPATVDHESFEGILLDVISQHHEYPNGRGYPDKLKGEEISFPARLVATLDRLDNLLFLNRKNEFDFDKAIAELKSLAGKKVDKDVVDVLTADPYALNDFADYLKLNEKERRRVDGYGIQYEIYETKNIRENDTAALYFDYYINDQFYGKLKQSTFYIVAEKKNLITELQKVTLERLCIDISNINAEGVEVPRIYFTLSGQHFMRKTFYTWLLKTLKKYGIHKGQFSFGVSEIDIQKFQFDLADAISKIHDLGMTFHMAEFGEQLSLLYVEGAHFDQLILKKFYSDNMQINPQVYNAVVGIAKIAIASHFDVVFSGVNQRITEESLLKLGIPFAFGNLYGEPLSRKAFLSAYEPSGGEDEQ